MCPRVAYDADSGFTYMEMAGGVHHPRINAQTISHYQNVFAEPTYENTAIVQNPTIEAQPLYGN